jgi:hypothetical protein
MAKAGFCAECNANAWLNDDGSCLNGHPASSVSNVYDAAPSAAPPRKSHTGLIVGIIIAVLALPFISGIVVAIAVPVFRNASSNAQKKSCFANEHVVEGGIEVYRAENPDAPTPPDWASAMTALVPTVIKSEPRCPAGGTYELTAPDGPDAAPVVACSIHGAPLDSANP